MNFFIYLGFWTLHWRMFKNIHGIMPISARDRGVSLKAYPRMSFQISIRGDVEMNYRIEQRGAFEMFGVYGLVSQDLQMAFTDVPQFRKQCDENGSVYLMNEMLGRFDNTMLHAALYDHTGESFKHMECYHLPKGLEIPKRFTKLSVPALTFAIFPEPQCDIQNYGNGYIPNGSRHPDKNRLRVLNSKCIMEC